MYTCAVFNESGGLQRLSVSYSRFVLRLSGFWAASLAWFIKAHVPKRVIFELCKHQKCQDNRLKLPDPLSLADWK